MIRTIIVCLLFIPTLLHAQIGSKAWIDSMQLALVKAKEDTNKANILNSLSFRIRETDPVLGLKYGSQSLSLSEKLGWTRGMANAKSSLSSHYEAAAEYGKAMTYALAAIKLFEELGDKRSISINLDKVGNIYAAQSNNVEGLNYLLKSLSVAESINDRQRIALTNMNIGSVYLSLENYPKALEFYEGSLKKFEEINTTDHIAECLSNMGVAYLEMHNYNRALTYFTRALKTNQSANSKMVESANLANIGHAYMGMHNFAKAVEFENRALSISEELGDKEGIAIIFLTLGDAYLQMAQDTTARGPENNVQIIDKKQAVNKAVAYLERGLQVAKEVGILTLLSSINEKLTEGYRLSGKPEAALESYIAHIKFRDSIFSTDNTVKIASLETQRETELKEKQIEINAILTKQKHEEQLLLLAIMTLLIGVIIAVFRSDFLQRKANRVKGKLLDEKDILLKEIHHRVKNNLQVICALLDIQVNSISDIPAREAIIESITRVKSISLIHQQLYQNENISTINITTFTENLLQRVTSVHKTNDQHIALSSDFGKIEIDIDTAVPLGLILNELMTNSFKHAFANVTNGVIDVSIKNAEGYLTLTYKDSGPGLPIDMDFSTLKSLGIKLIGRLSKQIGGKLDYIRADNAFVVTFKDAATRKLSD
jgi:two-component system, sensor histidine kinase PdtaS